MARVAFLFAKLNIGLDIDDTEIETSFQSCDAGMLGSVEALQIRVDPGFDVSYPGIHNFIQNEFLHVWVIGWRVHIQRCIKTGAGCFDIHNISWETEVDWFGLITECKPPQ